MIEQVFFSNKVGQGIMTTDDEKEETFVNKTSIFLNGESIEPGSLTTLQNFFKKPIQYVGIYKGTRNLMVFYLGTEGLFKYYDCYYKIADKVIFKKYTEGSGRTFNYIKDKWK